jgi:prophage DNA circulation protein
MTWIPQLTYPAMPYQPWREAILPASFKGAGFHVETDARVSGRRIALHEFPKRDDPYAEDMGKRAVRYAVTGYLITAPGTTRQSAGTFDYRPARDRLINALESDGPGPLVHPLLPNNPLLVMCEAYTVTETRERGGMATFEMTFVEAGSPLAVGGSSIDTQDLVRAEAVNANAMVALALRQALSQWSGIKV